MPYLRSLALGKVSDRSIGRYPFTVPIIRDLGSLAFDAPVTFLVGENGSGKSTLLEALAFAANLPTIGSEEVRRDATLAPSQYLARSLKLVWDRRTTRGFFLRAEDFFGYTKMLAKMRADLLDRLQEIDVEFEGRSDWSKGLAKGPVNASLADMERRYGVDLNANSHGESFLKLFQSRFVPGGLYLLDEPEAPLSPQSQLGFLAMIGDMVKQQSQFIIATHSPIILGFPDAAIYSCDSVPIARVAFDDLEHVTLTRDFLNARERFLRHL